MEIPKIPVNLPSGHGAPEMLAEDFGDPVALLNSRTWLDRAMKAAGATITGGGCGCGQADTDIILQGYHFNVSIRPIIMNVGADAASRSGPSAVATERVGANHGSETEQVWPESGNGPGLKPPTLVGASPVAGVPCDDRVPDPSAIGPAGENPATHAISPPQKRSGE